MTADKIDPGELLRPIFSSHRDDRAAEMDRNFSDAGLVACSVDQAENRICQETRKHYTSQGEEAFIET